MRGRDITPEQYLKEVTGKDCTVTSIKRDWSLRAYEVEYKEN
jgi:hypothetical protein